MKTNQLRAMMLTVMLVITTLGGTVWAQPLIVKGTVTDGSDSSPLVGCAVTVKGTSRGTVTNLQGEYRIEARGKLLSSAILVLRKWKKSYSLQQ
jgi:Ca-activated chloride channel family protein